MRTPIIFEGIELEKVCPICKGKPPSCFLLGPWCDTCRGVGYILTEKGTALCQLVIDHLTGYEGNMRFK